MKYSTLFPKTSKREFKEDLSTNAKYLVKGGYIDQLMAGSWTLLPLGLKVVANIEEIIREEMNVTGAQEILMPLLHPKSIWNETGRWDSAREVMYQFKKDDKEYALSFTHEEIVLDLVRKRAQTYRDFPIKIYHFSTKFRNELRAKSGILRGREFLMKDLYSLSETEEEFDKYYEEVTQSYLKIFKRLGLETIVTEAAGGVFTKNVTHEFQVLSDVGEDEIIYCPGGDFSQNTEIAKVKEGKQCDLGHGPLKRAKSIEVGNIFGFGQEYSKKMNVIFTNKKGESSYPYLGSYGIGITRVMGAIVEIFSDEDGIVWPKNISPYNVYLISLRKDAEAEEIEKKLEKAGIEVLFDDRDASAGEKFANADLLGIPNRLVISEKTDGKIELKIRKSKETTLLSVDEVISKMQG